MRYKMNKLQIYMQDSFIELKKFECRDLSYSLFNNIDFHKYKHLVSFFRSDFRGSKFTDIMFYKNIFDRSDFLNAVFIDCCFEKVQFGCCQIKNCYFKNVKFTNNIYGNTSIHSTTFINCEFPDEVFLINMQHCILVNCTFNGCTFEKSTTENDTFEDCRFINTNLATMHAENHKFINCKFDGVLIDSSYFFSYSIANCTWTQVMFLYRGERVCVEAILVNEFLQKLEMEHRYNDILNFYINKNVQEKIPAILKKGFGYYKDTSYGRMLDISAILESLAFAAIYETIDYIYLQKSLTIVDEIDMSSFSFNERIEIDALRTKFKDALYLKPHSEKFLSKIDINSKSTLSIKLNSDDYDKCVEISKRILNIVSEETYWTLIEKQKGSWTLIYSAATVIVLTALPKIVKNFADVYFDIKSKKALSDKIMKKLESTDISINDIKKLVATTQEAELLLPSGKCINKNISKDLKDIIISSITANI